jgi:hypothetical protein
MRNALSSLFAIAVALLLITPAFAAPRAGETIKVTNDTDRCVFLVVRGHQPDNPEHNDETLMMKPRQVEYYLVRSETIKAVVYANVHQDAFCGRPIREADFTVRPTLAKHNIRIVKEEGRSYTARGGFDAILY